MARNGLTSLVRAGIKVAKAIDRENKRQARIREQRLRAEEREQRRRDKEANRQLAAALREEKRQRLAAQREEERLAKRQSKEAMQAFVQAGQDAFAMRCKERAAARENLLRQLYN